MGTRNVGGSIKVWLRHRLKRTDNPWALFRWQDIFTNEGNLYLRRLHLISTPLFGIKLHWFKGPDPDRHLHDHPWSFISFVLKGGYIERVFGKTNRIRFFSIKRATDSHTIRSVESGTLTLVFNGPKVRKWGFWVNGTWIYWRQYWN